MTGQILAGRYLIAERLGSGSFGDVYRARELELNREVAVKVLRAPWSDDERYVAGFEQEARAASAFQHPNAVLVYDAGTSDEGVPYIVMELVRGGTLRRLMQTEGAISASRAGVLLLQILGALEAAHGSGIVHGDLKPKNILIERKRSGVELAKLIDFGTARRPGERRSSSLICGTPTYMAPEVIRGEAPLPASDIYAVGVVLYELLTGVPPFTGDSPEEILEDHLRAPLMPPSDRNPARPVEPRVSSVVCRALARSPGDRFSTSAHFRGALAAALEVPALSPFFSPAAGARGRRVAPAGCAKPWRVPAATRDTVELARGSEPDAASDRVTPVQTARAIGRALGRGDAARLCQLYLRRAEALAGEGGINAAIAELEEGLALMTGGAGLQAGESPAPTWELAHGLAMLYERRGQRRRALQCARAAYRHAILAREAAGSAVTRELVRSLLGAR